MCAVWPGLLTHAYGAQVVHVEDSRSMLFVNLVRLGGVISDRVFATWFTWREEDDRSFLVAWAPLEEYSDVNQELVAELNSTIQQDYAAAKAVRGTSTGCWRIKPFAPNACQVTYVVAVSLGGSIPQALLNSRIKNTINTVQNVQRRFERSGNVVDKEMRAAFAFPPALAALKKEQR